MQGKKETHFLCIQEKYAIKKVGENPQEERRKEKRTRYAPIQAMRTTETKGNSQRWKWYHRKELQSREGSKQQIQKNRARPPSLIRVSTRTASTSNIHFPPSPSLSRRARTTSITPAVSPRIVALPVSKSSVLSSSILFTYVSAFNLPSLVGVEGESRSMEVLIAVLELEREMADPEPDPEDEDWYLCPNAQQISAHAYNAQ